MSELYNWSSFYETLGQHGSKLLLGIDDNLRELIEELGANTDIFWSDGLQEFLAEGATYGDLRAGVLLAIELWRQNALTKLDSDFGIMLDWGTVTINLTSPIIDLLVEAATPS